MPTDIGLVAEENLHDLGRAFPCLLYLGLMNWHTTGTSSARTRSAMNMNAFSRTASAWIVCP